MLVLNSFSRSVRTTRLRIKFQYLIVPNLLDTRCRLAKGLHPFGLPASAHLPISNHQNQWQMISQKEFLIGQGIDQYSSPEQIQTAKKAYRKTYVKHYQKEYNQSTKRVKLTFNLREFHLLHKAALKHQKPLASFGKECV